MLSAYGIGIADVKAIREASWLRPLNEDFSSALADLEQRAHDALLEQGLHGERIELFRRARLRTSGSDTTLEMAIGPVEETRAALRQGGCHSRDQAGRVHRSDGGIEHRSSSRAQLCHPLMTQGPPS